jgi:hypothetical protein
VALLLMHGHPSQPLPAAFSVQCCSQAPSCCGLEFSCVLLSSKPQRIPVFLQILGHRGLCPIWGLKIGWS